MKKFTYIKIFWATSLVLVILILSTPKAQTIEYGGFGGRPAYPRNDNPRTESIFIHTLNPGETKEEGVIVLNNTTQEKTLLIYSSDSTPSTDGAFACKQLSEEKKDVGSWISLAKSEVTLKPKTNEMVPFAIKVPDNASVGEHNGCILIQEKKAESHDSGVSLSVRTGLRVAITIPGELVRKLEIISFKVKSTKDGFLLHPEVKNTGNVSIDADVEVKTVNLIGREYFEHGGQYPILRGETSGWNFELKKPFWGGWYRAQFQVEYDQNKNAGVGIKSGQPLKELSNSSVWFFSFPKIGALLIEVAIFLLIIVVLIFLRLRRKNQNKIKKNWEEINVRSSLDTIQSIAKDYDIPWKQLAKVNKLKPPYELKRGQTIKVPPVKK